MNYINLKGKKYATFNGVLDEAHKQGLEMMSKTITQLPTADNNYVCVIEATVVVNGKHYEATGDATPKNVNKMIVPHLIRMAETRAYGRALRFATNAPTLVEELSEVSSYGNVK
jgi:hypothetical protein